MNNHAMNVSMKEACAVEIQLEELFKPWEKHETKEEISADLDGARNWLNNTSDGLIYAISIFFFRNKPAAYPFTDADIRYRLEMASNTFSTMYPGGF